MRGHIVKRQGKKRDDRGKLRSLYYIVYPFGGKQKWEKVPPPQDERFATRTDAQNLLAKRITEIVGGEFVEPKKITLEEFIGIWMKTYAEGEGEIRPSTLTQYRGFFKNHLGPTFGPKQLTAITVKDVQDYKARKLNELKEKKGADGEVELVPRNSPQSVKHHLRLLRQMLRHAIDWGYLRANPAEKVKNPTIAKRETDALSPEEFQAFYSKLPEEWQLFFLVTVSGGLRMGEALAMRWANLNWRSGQYHVKETWLRSRGGEPHSFGPPKSPASAAPIDLVPEAIEALRSHRTRQKAQKLEAGQDYNDQDLIFATDLGAPLDDSHVKQRSFFPALEAAGLRRIRFHDLRHTCASILIDAGESPKYIQKQMRHASIEMTFNTYGHLFPDSNREAATRFGRVLFGTKAVAVGA